MAWSAVMAATWKRAAPAAANAAHSIVIVAPSAGLAIRRAHMIAHPAIRPTGAARAIGIRSAIRPAENATARTMVATGSNVAASNAVASSVFAHAAVAAIAWADRASAAGARSAAAVPLATR